jgi:flagellar hook-associated protein 3 FlgL
MAINRVTQHMMMNRSNTALQTGLGRLARTQEQLTTGRVLNRPSDSPTDTTSAMRLRASMGDQNQYSRNAEDGIGWLGQLDTTMTSMLGQVQRARNLGIQGVNGTNQGPAAREALAVEVDQLRESLINDANKSYLGRPVFGGLVNGTKAYDASGAFVGVTGDVMRTVAKDIKVSVNVNGPEVFGTDGANLFDDLQKLSDSLRLGDQAGVQASLTSLDTAQNRLTSALSDVGTRSNRLERAVQAAKDSALSLRVSLSNVEDVDLAKATMDLQMHELAYQAALASTARLVQPSLSDFLR